jgi:hypothetical protein
MKMENEYIEKIIEVGQKGYCDIEELNYFLPNQPTLRGSELIFMNPGRYLRDMNYSEHRLQDLIKGCHLIERKYVEITRNNYGFGSPSPTSNLLNDLEVKTQDHKTFENIYDWVAFNGGNYDIKPNVDYASSRSKLKVSVE